MNSTRGLGDRKSAYVLYPQAVPLKYAIDKDTCIYFKKSGKCKACEKFCPAGAVDFDQKGQVRKVNVGVVILASGFSPYDPKQYHGYQYGHLPNVVTSLEFERILSASGPFQGHLVTSKPGVFAAGDVHTGPWIAIEAVGGGIEAAESIDRYLRGIDMKEGRQEGKEAHKRWAGPAQGRRGGSPGGNGDAAPGSQLPVF